MGISFEFFPPKTDAGLETLSTAVIDLAAWQPRFVTVTCGAGGSATGDTFGVVKHIREKSGLAVAPHLAFSRQSRTQIDEILQAYKKIGIRDIIAIRGDPAAAGAITDAAYINTVDFVADLRARYGFDPIVAAYPDVHPLALSPQQDMDHLKRKAEAGSHRAITQFFFEADTFLRFRDRVRDAAISVTLTPGILPVHNLAQALKFSASCGAKVPAGFADRFERHGDDATALFEESVAHATRLCETLRRVGVEDFHFYTLNRSAMTNAICAALGFVPMQPQSTYNSQRR